MNRIFSLVMAGVATLLLLSCSPRLYPTETAVRRDTVYINRVQIDSIYKKDSIFIREKNDTVLIYKEKVREKYKIIHDTTYISKVDTLHRTVVQEVRKPLSGFVKFQMWGFWILFLMAVSVIAWKVYKFLK